MARKRDPFEVTLSSDRRQKLGDDLAQDVQDAINARSGIVGDEGDIDYWWELYDQEPTRTTDEKPWPDAADLTSYIGTEKVDALHARLMQHIFTEPLYIVEGVGEAANRAPIVEEFHQWKVEEERLQTALDGVVLNALVEGNGILETSEKTGSRVTRRTIRAAAQVDPETGGAIIDAATGKTRAQVGEDQKYVEYDGVEGTPTVDVVIDETAPLGIGPQHRIINLKDFLFLPGHAKNQDETRGYAKRFWLRMPELQQRVKDRIYEADAVARLGTSDERQGEATIAGQAIQPQEGPTAEKELYELLILLNLDGKGERWCIATISRLHRVLLRIQYDDGGRRYLNFVPFPRTTSRYGRSFLYNKLGTIIEEHTALRNMIADRSAVATAAPIKRLEGSLWNRDEQPWGPGADITVRAMNELEQMIVSDVPASAIERERECLAASERVSGINDAALGVNPQADRTLGEFQAVAGSGSIRIETIRNRLRETMEELFQIRHELWRRALRNDKQGMEAPSAITQALEGRGVGQDVFSGRFTADLLEGTFKGTPRGSIETANPQQRRADFVQFMNGLANMLKLMPMLQAQMNSPQATRAMLEELIQAFRFRNKQALLGPPPSAQVAPVAPGMPPPTAESMSPPGATVATTPGPLAAGTQTGTWVGPVMPGTQTGTWGPPLPRS